MGKSGLEIKPLGEVVDLMATGKTPSTLIPEYFDKEINWFTPGDIGVSKDLIFSSRFISKKAVADKKAILFPEETLLITCIGDIGRVGIVKKPSSSNQQITGIKFKNYVDVNYGYYWFIHNSGKLNHRANSAVVPILNNGTLRQIDFSYPDLKTQQKIASILEQADAARQKRKQANQLTEQFLQSAFLEMFADPVRNEKGWEKQRLDKISKLQRGRFSPRPRNDPSYFNGEYPFIQTGDISRSGNRLSSYSQTLNEKGIKVSKKFSKGVIVIAIVGATIGATAILEIDVYATDSIIGIKANDSAISNCFLEFALRFWKPILLRDAPEVARPNINLEILNKLEIILPPLPLQKKFAALVEQVEQLQVKQRESEKELENLFQSLMQKYFAT